MKKTIFLLWIGCYTFLSAQVYIQDGVKAYYDLFESNNIHMWVANAGEVSSNPDSRAGFYWDGTSEPNAPAVYCESPVLGFKSKGEIKVYCSFYRLGFEPGYIGEDGTVYDTENSSPKVYNLVKNWEDLPAIERRKYRDSYESWPAERGAPYIDVNGNGYYDKGIDKPQVYGNQTLWWSNHTVDSAVTTNTYTSYGDSVEVQTTLWGENSQFKDVVFRKYIIINKNSTPLIDMYFGYFSDVDLGAATGDYAGYDAEHQLSYVYNGDSVDFYYGDKPPAIGYFILDGPVVESTNEDTAVFNGKVMPGYKNLDLNASIAYSKMTWLYDWPFMGNYEQGTLAYYYRMMGLDFRGYEYINPVTNQPTKFILDGDPVAGTGWYEGEGWPPYNYLPSERGLFFSSGPFNIEPGESQCIVMATAIARGEDHISSITALRNLVKEVRENYEKDNLTDFSVVTNIIPDNYNMYQNYPNPFNPATTIEFTIPIESNVKLEVFDVLGRKVSELVNGKMNIGKHSVSFNGAGLSSGVYIYRLISGDIVFTKKMMLLK